jgi:hypothetical protein
LGTSSRPAVLELSSILQSLENDEAVDGDEENDGWVE